MKKSYAAIMRPRRLTEMSIGAVGVVLAAVAGVALAHQPVLFLGALGGIGLILLALQRSVLFVSVWLVSFFVPYLVGGNELLKVGFGLALVIGAVKTCANFQGVMDVMRRHWRILTAALMLMSWIALSILWATDIGAAVGEVAVWCLAMVAFVWVLAAIDSERTIVVLLWAWFAGAGLSALTALLKLPVVDAAVAVANKSERSGGGAGDPNILAAGLVASIALAVGLWAVTPSTAGRFAIVGLGTVSLAGLAGSASRGAVVAVGVAAIAAIGVSNNRRRTAGVAAVGLPGVALAWSFLSPESWLRVSDFGGGGTGRTELWRAAAQVWSEHRLVGAGIGNLVVVEPGVALDIGPLAYGDLIAERPLVAHSLYLQLLSELGVVGFALYATVVLISINAALSAARLFTEAGRADLASLCRAVYVAVIALFGAALFLSMGREYRVWVLLAAGPLLLAAANRLPRADGLAIADPIPTLQGV